MGRYKKYIAILLMFSVYMMPFNARAAGMGGWTLSNPLAQGASTIYQGAKNVIINGKNVAKTSTALITPVAKDVSKVLVRGVAGVALSFAVEQLLGKVDWVLDPANNQIVYTKPKDPTVPDPTAQMQYVFVGGVGGCTSIQVFYSVSQAKEDAITCFPDPSFTQTTTIDNNGTRLIVWFKKDSTTRNAIYNISANPAYDPNAQTDEEKKTLPLDVVAQKVISNAESGNSDAKVATTAAAADIVNDAQNDDVKAKPIVNQLEANAKTEADNTATGETKPNTETGGTDLALEFPTFCGWAPQVCEAAQVVINFPQTLTDWWETSNKKADSWAKSVSEAWTAVKDWVKEPEKEDTEIDLDNPVQTEPDTTISFSTACPAKIPLTFNWNGQTLDFSFDFTIWCEAVSTFVYPIVVALGSLHALYIVAGVRQDG